MHLRDYQIELASQSYDILKKFNIVYLGIEMRVGKTLISLEVARLYKAKNVLFITKKKAISSIQKDYDTFSPGYSITVVNYESVHKVEGNFDLVIVDEAHTGISSFPKPSVTFKAVKKFGYLPMIFLSGTPLIESGSKIYHSLGVSNYSPFKSHKNFYDWFRTYGVPRIIYTSYGQANDYSNVKMPLLLQTISKYFVTYTQKDAGFTTSVREHVLKVKMKDTTYGLIAKLLNDKVIEGKVGSIIGDTSVKLQNQVHQLYSGTIKLEEGNAITIDRTKAEFIRDHFKGKKIAILYCFVEELRLLNEVLGNITNDIEEFNSSDKNFVGQIVATREGVNLSAADALVFYNIPFSGTSYVQGKERATSKDRLENNVYFICSEGGIEEKILGVVRQKKTYSDKIFKKDFLH